MNLKQPFNPFAAAYRSVARADARTKSRYPLRFDVEIADRRKNVIRENDVCVSRCEDHLACELILEGTQDVWCAEEQMRELASSLTYRAMIRSTFDSMRSNGPLTDILLHARLYNAGRLAGRAEQRRRDASLQSADPSHSSSGG